MSLSIQEIRERVDVLERGGAIRLTYNMQWYKLISGRLWTSERNEPRSPPHIRFWEPSRVEIAWVIYKSQAQDIIWLPEQPPSQQITHVRRVEL